MVFFFFFLFFLPSEDNFLKGKTANRCTLKSLMGSSYANETFPVCLKVTRSEALLDSYCVFWVDGAFAGSVNTDVTMCR